MDISNGVDGRGRAGAHNRPRLGNVPGGAALSGVCGPF